MNSIKRLFIPIVVVALAILTILIYMGLQIYDKYYGMHRIDPMMYTPTVAEDEYSIVYNCEYNGKAIMYNDKIYIDADVLNEEWANELIFYAEDINTVFYTTQIERFEYPIGQGEFIERDGKVYMQGKLASEMFGVRFTVNDEAKLVMVRRPSVQGGNVEKFRTYLKANPDDKEQNYTVEVGRNDPLEIYGEEVNGYYYAVNEDGYMGWVDADRITLTYSDLSIKYPESWITDEDLLYHYKLTVGFQQVYSSEKDVGLYYDIRDTFYYVKVLSPTWLSINTFGGLSSKLNEDYVAWAKKNDYEIWPVFTNSFDDDLTYRTLTDTKKREALIDQVIDVLVTYEFEGINLDFEGLSERTYPYFIQFLREFSIAVRSRGILLSIDTMVPSPWTDYYRRDLYADLCDYIIIMAYDEYWGGSETAGPVSSRDFTMKAISDMLNMGISKDKLVLGIPWYTRVWYGDDYDLRTSVACGMEYAWGKVWDYGLQVEYDEKTGMNYAHGYYQGEQVRVWLEDETSSRFRLKMAVDTGLAGLAFWSVGLENYMIWPAYEDILLHSNF